MSSKFLKGFKWPVEACIFLLDRLETPLKPTPMERKMIMRDVSCCRETLQRALRKIRVRQLLLLAETNVLLPKYNAASTNYILRLGLEKVKKNLFDLYDLFIKLYYQGGEKTPLDDEFLKELEGMRWGSENDR